MKRYGFIRTKKEIEYLVLYVMSLLKEPVVYQDLADMAICDGGFDHFEFSDALAELVDLGNVEVTEPGGTKFFELSEKGRQAAQAFERSVPASTRIDAGRAVANVYMRKCREAMIHASHSVRKDGTMAVNLSFIDGETPVFAFELMVPNEHQARLYEKNFRKYAEKMYDGMICVLLNEYGEPDEWDK